MMPEPSTQPSSGSAERLLCSEASQPAKYSPFVPSRLVLELHHARDKFSHALHPQEVMPEKLAETTTGHCVLHERALQDQGDS